MEAGEHLRETIESQAALVERLLGDEQAASAVAPRIAAARRIFLVGTGTSFHGAMVGEFLFRTAGRDAWAVPAFEFVHYGPDLRADDALVLISHRGSKRFSNEALERFASKSDAWVVVTGEGSAFEGAGAIRTCPQEKSSVHTASHTGAMVRLAQLARALSVGGLSDWDSSLRDLPAGLASASQLRRTVAAFAGALDLSRPVHFVGAGPAWATAMEGALKLGEASYVSTVAHELEGVLHGPLLSIGSGQAVVVISPAGPSLPRAREVIAALKAIGAVVVAVGSAAKGLGGTAWSLQTPTFPEALAPIINVIPLQWLSYEVARRVGVDPDTFRSTDAAYAAAQEAPHL